MKKLFCLGLLVGLSFGLPCLSASPQAFSLSSGSYLGGRGPAWMTLTLQGEDTGGNTQEWLFESAELSWSRSRQSYSANVLDELLRIQRFKVGSNPKEVQFVYQIPKALLEMDTVDTTLSVSFRTSANIIVGPISNTETNVDIRTWREQNWDRFPEIPRTGLDYVFPGNQQTVVAYQPGNYLTFDYYGAGLFAQLGIAANMGNIQVMLDGDIVIPALDLYPTNLPATVANFDAPRTDYRKTRLINTSKTNANHRLTLTILPTSNPKSSGNLLALTAFNVERYYNAGNTINEYDIYTTSDNLLLYSKPSIFNGNILLGQMMIAANVSSFIAVLSANNYSNLITVNMVAQSGNFSSSNVSSNAQNSFKLKLPEEESSQGRLQAASQTQLLPTGSMVILDLDNGQNKTSHVYESLAGQRLELTDLDKIHHVQIQVATSLGQTSSTNGFYIVALSQPTPWPAGQSQLNLLYQGQSLQLTRTDTSSSWEVGVIDATGLLSPSGKKVLVVQLPGIYKNLDFQVSSPLGLKALTGEGTSVDSSSLSLKKSNFVELSPATVSATPSTTSAGTTSTSGGGGGCLLR